jgi:hypothetical protein
MNKTSVPFIAVTVWAVFGGIAEMIGKPILNIWWHAVPFLYMVHVVFLANLMDTVLKEVMPEMISEIVKAELQEVLVDMDADIQDLVFPASDDEGYHGGMN